MEFDKSKVYTALNADNIIVGSKGYFADNLYELEEIVLRDDKDTFFIIKEILSKDENFRFLAENCNGSDTSWNLFYLVEEPKEKNYRPYKDTNEMIEDFKNRYNSYGGWSGKSNPMYCPLIWLKDKDNGQIYLVRSFWNDKVFLGISDFSLDFIFEQYTYLDGLPCGIEE